ncbi:hypothetical protein BC943DRAFT_325551 [Umbelopsis sp. AD052]|nr:hypothetical protein BC943DRAFT_325551 [Umbelopsis sp. AD052]
MEILTPARAANFEFQRQLDVPNEGTVTFPLVFTPEAGSQLSTIEEAVAWVETNQTKLLELAKVHGAILLRDFPITTAEHFDAIGKAVGLAEFPYIGGAAPRTVITGSVFTANESPADQLIPYHHELAQSKNHPLHIMFYCDKPADKGGETPICLSNLIYEQISREFPDFIEEIGKKGVKYIRVLPVEDDATSAIGRGWQSTFMTTDAKEAERQAEELGMTLEWLPDGSLKTTSPILPATKLDERTGKVSWFNSIVAAFTGWQDSRNDATKAVVYGDGSPLDPVILRRCLDIMNELCCSFEWKKGDVILIDNVVTMHSRNSFEGSRRIYASLWK